MPAAPSTSWVTECAACHHSNPVRAHFCSVCGAALQSPAAEGAARAAAPAQSGEPATAETPEPKGFMLHFNDDNSLAIAPRYAAPDPGEAIPAAAARHAERLHGLPAPQPAAAGALAAWRPSAAMAAGVLALLGLVGTGSYLLGRSSVPASAPALAGNPATAVQSAAMAPTEPAAAMPQALAPATATPAMAAVHPTQAVVAPAAVPQPAPSVQARQAVVVGNAAAPPRTVIPAPAMPAVHAPGANCNPTVAALGLCDAANATPRN